MFNAYSSTITSKGQATIPAPLRRKLNVKPGQKILFVEQPNGVLINRIPDISELKGSLKPRIKVRYTDKKANEAIGRMLAEEYAKTR